MIDLAATYTAAISGDHPLIDGNKRVAFVALGQFLDDNGMELAAAAADATAAMMALASRTWDVKALAAWFRGVVGRLRG